MNLANLSGKQVFRARAWALAWLTLLAMPSGGAVAAEPSAAELDALEQRAFQAAVEKIAPSVVRIETVGGLERVESVLFGTGPTTGLVVDPQGYIISSAFSFLNRPASILVRLGDGTRKPAELVATDHSRMLVLLRIHPAEPLPVGEFAPQSELRVGQWTIAVGRTFEADKPNLTVGILSALGRVWEKAIQTDAIVSPNNYGGPLVDIRGRVLGVIVPLSPQSADEVAGVEWYDAGIGFAVPAEHLRAILPRLQKGEDLYPGLLGISFKGSLEIGEATIAGCHPNSPAADAGLKQGDTIVEIDGRKIRRAIDAKCEIGHRYAGDRLRMVVLRGTQRLTRDVELVAKLKPYEHALLGLLPLRGGERPGIGVRYAYPGGGAAQAGIVPGDVLLSLAGKPITTPGELRDELSTYKPDQKVEVEIRHNDQTRKVQITLGRVPDDLPPAELPPAHANTAPFEGQRPQVGSVSLKIPELNNDVWAYVPEDYHPQLPYGVVVWLHAAGGFEPQELLKRWKPLCDRFDLIVVAPKPSDPQRWSPLELDMIEKVLGKVDASYHVDRARVVVSGHEGGGRLAYLAAAGNREMIRAVAMIDAAPLGRPLENDPLHRLALYVAVAKKAAHAGDIREAVSQLRELKVPVTVKDLGDEPRQLNAEELAELVRWIDMLDRI